MAQIRPKPARPPSSRPPAMRRRSQRRKRRIGSSVAKVGPPLSILDEPSPTINGTSTTENAMLFWVGWFARFHLDPEGPRYVPHQIRTLDRPVCRPDGTPVLHADGQPLMMRCIREVAHAHIVDDRPWMVFHWLIGEPGLSIQKFATLDAALAAFNATPEPAVLP